MGAAGIYRYIATGVYRYIGTGVYRYIATGVYRYRYTYLGIDWIMAGQSTVEDYLVHGDVYIASNTGIIQV